MNRPLVRPFNPSDHQLIQTEKAIAARIAERRAYRNAFVAFVVALFAGWGYAQLARLMGAPPQLIGLTAIGIEAVVFACGIYARLGDHIWRRK